MPDFPQNPFPTMQTIMDLARSKVNDMFPGTGGQNGRILTNDAPFTLPYFNSALRTLARKLRNEGVTFPIKDNVLLLNIAPVAVADPSVQVSISFNGYFDGTTMHPTPVLPSDCLQVLNCWEQQAGSNLQYTSMLEPEGGLPSSFQGPALRVWEWRQYAIFSPGSLVAQNMRIRYQSGIVPLNVSAQQFASTTINILDCEDAIAGLIATEYGDARGADTTKNDMKTQAAIDDMANEWVRRSQSVTYRRPSYKGGGSGSNNDGSGSVGQTGVIA